jgi:hypothetical protein
MQKKEKTCEEAAETEGAEDGGAAEPWVTPATLGLFLLPSGRPGRRLTGASDEVPAATGALFLFLLPWGRPRPRGATGDPGFRWEPPASAIIETGEPLDEEEEHKAAEEEYD